MLEKLLCNPSYGRDEIVYYIIPSRVEPDITNSIYLLGAFLVLKLGATPEQAWRPFSAINRKLTIPFRDATWIKSTFDLYHQDMWAGLRRAVSTSTYVPAGFDKAEYFYYDDPLNGDLHEVVPSKFIAFRGPIGKPWRTSSNTYSLEPHMYCEVFR